jgi:NitT/TauT family transport system substrate-binding protein
MKTRRLLGLMLVLSLVIAACGGDTEGATDTTEAAEPAAETTVATEATTETTAATDAGTEETTPAAEELVPETTEFTFATGGIGFSWVSVMTAIDILNDSGWTIDTPELSASELQVEGVARGEFDMSAGSTNSVLTAVQAEFPIKMVVERVKTEWTLYADAGSPTCQDLDGVTLAIHSEGSPATFMTRNWIGLNCPDIEPNYLILPGSENRFAALLAGEINASPIELSDAIALEAEAPGDFTRLASFSADLPDLRTTNVYGNTEFMEANPNTVTIFIKTIVEQNRRFLEDPEYLKEMALEHTGVNVDNIDAIVAAYSELEMFDPDGGLSPASQEYTVNFFIEAGQVE